MTFTSRHTCHQPGHRGTRGICLGCQPDETPVVPQAQPQPDARWLALVRVGDRVTVINAAGQRSTGRAVMLGPGGWVLNKGGRYGIPGIANESNIIGVRKGGK